MRSREVIELYPATVAAPDTLTAVARLLEVPPPSIDVAAAEAIAAEHFGAVGRATQLASERDCNFLLTTGTETARLLLKIANPAESANAVAAQTAALLHIAARDPELPVPRIHRTKGGELAARALHGDAEPLIVRLLDFLPDQALIGTQRSAIQRRGIGTMLGRLDRALEGFSHVGAARPLLWDIARAGELAVLLPHIADLVRRDLAARCLDGFVSHALPALGRLRSQVIHNDFNPHNLLVDAGDPSRITGIIDFGDMVRGPRVIDLAVAAAYHVPVDGNPLAEIIDLVTAYHSVNPLQPHEVDILFDLAIARQIATVTITAWRATLHPENSQYILRNAPSAWHGLQRLTALPRREAQHTLRAACGMEHGGVVSNENTGKMANAFDVTARAEVPTAQRALIERREQLLGPAYRLFYAEPLHIVRGEGVWLYDASGAKYLDAYNNVASLGHCHPHVVEAITRQVATLATHTRYLHEGILDYAERLLATFPAAIGHLMLTCTGSEANDLALRIAHSATGNTGLIVTDTAYHGVTGMVAEISPSLGRTAARAPHVRTVPGPREADPGAFTRSVQAAIEDLAKQGLGTAALICDTIFSSDGVVADPPGFLRAAVQAVQAAGGLFIADEVQAGFARTGDTLWGFQRHNLVPDLVTLGKPMGNGYPVAGVAMRPALVAKFGRESRYFNTFAGNPVAVAAANAVLDVIEQENLHANASTIGRVLRTGVGNLRERFPRIGSVRGAGLFIGVDIVDGNGAPDGVATAQLVNAMRRRQVLISCTGHSAHVLKIRPPLIFSEANARQLLDALEHSLAELP